MAGIGRVDQLTPITFDKLSKLALRLSRDERIVRRVVRRTGPRNKSPTLGSLFFAAFLAGLLAATFLLTTTALFFALALLTATALFVTITLFVAIAIA